MTRTLFFMLMACFLTLNGLCDEPLITDFEKDLETLIKAVDASDLEDYSKKLNRLKTNYAKAKSSKKKDGIKEDVADLKIELIVIDTFPDIWRAELSKVFRIKDEQLVGSTPTEDVVKSLIGHERSRLLNKNYPVSKRQALESEALKRFPIRKVGDKVTIPFNGRAISGRVNRMTASGALIGSTTVPMSDLTPDFHPTLMQTKRREFVKTNYSDKRQKYLEKLNKKLPSKVYRENGYVRYEGNWMPAQELVERIDARITELQDMGNERKKEKEELINTVKKTSIYGACGFVALLILVIIIAMKVRKT